MEQNVAPLTVSGCGLEQALEQSAVGFPCDRMQGPERAEWRGVESRGEEVVSRRPLALVGGTVKAGSHGWRVGLFVGDGSHLHVIEAMETGESASST